MLLLLFIAMRVTISIKKETHQKIYDVKARLMKKTGERNTIDDVLSLALQQVKT